MTPPGALLTERAVVRVQYGSPSATIDRTWSLEVSVPSGRRRGREPKVYVGVSSESGPMRWARWKRMLEEGEYVTRVELASGEGVSRAAVTMGLRKLVVSESALSGGD